MISTRTWHNPTRLVPLMAMTVSEEDEFQKFIVWFEDFENYVFATASEVTGLAVSSPATAEFLFARGVQIIAEEMHEVIFERLEAMPKFPGVFPDGFDTDTYRAKLDAFSTGEAGRISAEHAAELPGDIRAQAEKLLSLADLLTAASSE